MTFKGMLKIVMNDYRKQQEERMFSVVGELMRTRQELLDVQAQLRRFQLNATSLKDLHMPTSTISLFVQYNGFFNQLCDIRLAMTIGELLVKLRRLTGIPIDRPVRLRVLSEDGQTTLFFLHKERYRTLKSYHDSLKARMVLSIEDYDVEQHEKYLERSTSTSSSVHTYSFDESDV